MRTVLALGLALTAAPALAHEGDHTHMAAVSALRHLFSQPDHLILLALAAALVAAPVVRRAMKRVRR